MKIVRPLPLDRPPRRIPLFRLYFVHSPLPIPICFRAAPSPISDLLSCKYSASLRLHFVQGFFRISTQLRARLSVYSDVISCILCRDFRHGFVQAVRRKTTLFRARLFPTSDSISCRPHSDFRFTFVQTPSPAPRPQCGLPRRLVSFRTQNRPDMQHFVFVRDRKVSGLVAYVPAAESGPPDAPPQKNSHETCPKPPDSRSAPPDRPARF